MSGRCLPLVKFRSMIKDAEAGYGPVWAKEGPGKKDPRFTPIGDFLRKTHLDELQQIFQVFIGSMSIVGPGPERQEILNDADAEFLMARECTLNLKPGLTGPAQLRQKTNGGTTTMHHKFSEYYSYSAILCSVSLMEYLGKGWEGG